MKRAFILAILILLFGPAISAVTLKVKTARVSVIKPPANTGPEVADNFTGTDGTALASHTTSTGGYSWVALATSFEIIGNVITNDAHGSGTTGYYVNHTMSSADCTATIDISVNGSPGSSEATLAIRATSDASPNQDAYFVSYFPDIPEVRLYKVVNGTSTILGTVYTPAATITNLWIQASGTTITAKANGLGGGNMTATDSQLSSAGFVGVGPFWRGTRDSSQINYDNLSVTVP